MKKARTDGKWKGQDAKVKGSGAGKKAYERARAMGVRGVGADLMGISDDAYGPPDNYGSMRQEKAATDSSRDDYLPPAGTWARSVDRKRPRRKVPGGRSM